jgi:hypothetical protein
MISQILLRWCQDRRKSSNLTPTTLIAGAFKLDQLLADPFQTFYASLIRHAHEADALLVAGYGFGDVHVNRALQNRLSIAPDSASPLLPVVVFTKCDASSQQMGIRQNSDIWARRLGETLNTTFDNLNWFRNSSLSRMSLRKIIVVMCAFGTGDFSKFRDALRK